MSRKKERLSDYTLSKKVGKSPSFWNNKKKDKEFWDNVWKDFYEALKKVIK